MCIRDSSTADDLTDVSTYPDSIGISVPRDLSDTITKTAEDIRTVDKDLSLIHISIAFSSALLSAVSAFNPPMLYLISLPLSSFFILTFLEF